MATAAHGYQVRNASFSLGSAAPRCGLHWRFICARCERPAHFMASAFCPETAAFFCGRCALATERVHARCYAWHYYFRYRSPWTGRWQPALDQAEWAGQHPYQLLAGWRHSRPWSAPDEHLARPAGDDLSAAGQAVFDEATVLDAWDRNAEAWDSAVGQDGDAVRKHQSDGAVLRLLGRVDGQAILDAGCGNGYLARKLAARGARMTGIDVSERMIARCTRYEELHPSGIAYRQCSASNLNAFADGQFDVIVCSYVLMSVADPRYALEQMWRVLRPGGRAVVVISHPCFTCGPQRWLPAAAGSPRAEDVAGYCVDHYLTSGQTFITSWAGFTPIPHFHRPLSDYWRAISGAGFLVTAFEEPGVPAGLVAEADGEVSLLARLPFSCLFMLARPEQRA